MSTGEKREYVRPTWDEYFIEVMEAVAKRATCDRGRSGCVIVRDNRLLVAGYVGSPVGLPHCDDAGHLIKKLTHEDGHVSEHCTRTVHAEMNAICQAARNGIAVEGATLYCRMTPCRNCAMVIINSGIKRVVAQRHYHEGEETVEMFKQTGIRFDLLNSEIEKYSK